jgi:hypothetical protein
MSLRRIRRGEALVLLGLLGLVVSLFLSWFDLDLDLAGHTLQGSQPGGDSGTSFVVSGDTPVGWDVLGHPWLEFLVIAGAAWIAVVLLALRAGRARPTYGAVVSVVVAIPLTALILLLTLIRTLLASPSSSLRDLGVTGFGNLDRLGDPDATVLTTSPAVGTWIGLASLLVALVGLWVAMADDRTSAAESVVEPPPASPIPEPRPVATDEAPPAA